MRKGNLNSGQSEKNNIPQIEIKKKYFPYY